MLPWMLHLSVRPPRHAQGRTEANCNDLWQKPRNAIFLIATQIQSTRARCTFNAQNGRERTGSPEQPKFNITSDIKRYFKPPFLNTPLARATPPATSRTLASVEPSKGSASSQAAPSAVSSGTSAADSDARAAPSRATAAV